MTPYLLVIPLNIHVGFFYYLFFYSSPLSRNFKKKEKKITFIADFLKNGSTKWCLSRIYLQASSGFSQKELKIPQEGQAGRLQTRTK
jgi:hypothetical protein